MSKITDPAPPDTSCSASHFAEVDFPRIPLAQPRLVVHFADGLKLLLCDRNDTGLAAELIATVRLIQRRHEKGETQ